ncbi:MAG: hypothetical protein J5846_11400 [Desulfovibrio sp.]|nr:hypothetical protein [Desulfovibrio sp.]
MKKQIASFTAALILFFPLLAEAQQSFITGTLQAPDGTALDGATIYVCTGLVKAEREAREGGKTRMVLYYTTAQPGSGKCEGTGKTGKGGLFKVRYPEGKEADLFAWKAGYEALIRRGVSSPSELGVLRLTGTNDSAIVEKRNIESAQQAARQKTENRAQEGLRRQKAWEEQEKTYPGGVHLPLPGIRDHELIARENSLPRRIKAIVLTPSGQLLEDGNENTVRISFGENIQVEKYSPKKWFLANAVSHGTFYGKGRIDVLAPHGKPWDICIWAKGYEPLLIRNVTAPMDLGTVKLTGTNTELEELPHTIK